MSIHELVEIFNPNPKDNCHEVNQEVTALENNNTISENISIFSKTCTRKAKPNGENIQTKMDLIIPNVKISVK